LLADAAVVAIVHHVVVVVKLRALTMCVHREQAAHLLDSTELHHLVEEALAILRR